MFFYRFGAIWIAACLLTALGVAVAGGFCAAQDAMRQPLGSRAGTLAGNITSSISTLPQRIIPSSRNSEVTPNNFGIEGSSLPGFRESDLIAPAYTFAPMGGSLDSPEVTRVTEIPSTAATDDRAEGRIVPAQFLNAATLPQSALSPSAPSGVVGNFRRVRISSRSDQPMDIISDVDPVTGRSVVLVSNGVNLVIETANTSPLLVGGVIDIAADRAAIWATQLDGLRRDTDHVQQSDNEMECYVEGNIVFRDGTRTIFADQMYYDAKNQIGYIRNGEMLMPIGQNSLRLEGVVRLRAETLRQQGKGQFSATNTMVTTSLLGVPTYSLRSRSLTLKETTLALTDRSGQGRIDPYTGKVVTKSTPWAIAENNFINLGGVPVFYWPWMASSLEEPTLYIKNFFYGYDGIFGHQVRTTWNPFQLFNIRNRPYGCQWDLNVDYLSQRGVGLGTRLGYDRTSCFGISGQTQGLVQLWGIHDTGHDNLGRDRRNVTFPDPYRYEALWKHRQRLGTGDAPWVVSGRVGASSDRNFLKQYESTAWLTEENRVTSLEIKKTKDDHSLGVSVEYAIDPFVTNTNWLPRADHYIIGRSVLHDRFTSYGHIRAGFAQYQTTSLPTDASDLALFNYLPWELSSQTGNAIKTESAVVSMRHELDLPLSLGPVKAVPFVMGDVAYWGKARNGDSADRAAIQGGVRFNLPLVKVNPAASNRLWYVNGLAHKVDLDTEVSYTSSNRRYDELILYDALDDWSTDDARRRAATTTFGSLFIPELYDPRAYAYRSGLMNTVTSPAEEVFDSLTLVRVGMTHRWQTKRGPVSRRNIIDWITLSTHINIYPDKTQNGDQSVGFLEYDLTWHVGDRFSIISSGIFDVDELGQKIVRIGGLSTKPGRSSLYLGVDSFSGAFERTYLTLAMQYTMNPKYAMTYATSYDFQRGKNVGHNFKFSRTGESFRLIAGVVYNESRNDWGFNFSIEPVFLYGLSNTMLGR